MLGFRKKNTIDNILYTIANSVYISVTIKILKVHIDHLHKFYSYVLTVKTDFEISKYIK